MTTRKTITALLVATAAILTVIVAATAITTTHTVDSVREFCQGRITDYFEPTSAEWEHTGWATAGDTYTTTGRVTGLMYGEHPDTITYACTVAPHGDGWSMKTITTQR